MNPTFISFLKSYFVFCCILAIPVFYIAFNVESDLVNPLMPLQFLFFVVLTGLLHYVLLRSLKKNPKLFISYFMTLTGLKMFLYLIILTTYLFLFKEQAKSFVVSFLLFYLLFTAFEAIALFKSSRSQEAGTQ